MTGKDLQRWRRGNQLSTRQVADALTLSHRTIQYWETSDYIPASKQARVGRLISAGYLAHHCANCGALISPDSTVDPLPTLQHA